MGGLQHAPSVFKLPPQAHAEDAPQAFEQWLSVRLQGLQEGERYKLLTDIADEFILLDIHAIVRMLEPIAHSESVLLEEAKAVVAVCDLHFWVSRQNTRKGLAPTVGAISRQLDQLDRNGGKSHSRQA